VLRESLIAAAVIAMNTILAAWQTKGQVGLATPENRSDAPRSFLVALYSLWVGVYVGMRTRWAGLWVAMIVFSIAAAVLSSPVTKAHEEEPISTAVPWHTPQVWSFHEDFHFILAGADGAWLALAITYH